MKIQKIFSNILWFWFKPIHSIKIEMFQKIFAFTFLIYMLENFQYANEWLTADGFHLSAKTKGWDEFTPLPLLQPYMIPIFGTILFGSTIAIIIGWREKIMLWFVFLCSAYVQNIDIITSFTLNTIYTVTFLILALTSSFKKNNENQSAWTLRILQATMLIMYFTAGTCKSIFGNWLKNPDVLWSQIQGVYCTDTAAWLLRNLPKRTWTFLQYGALIFELYCPVLFWYKRLRLFAILWGSIFELTIAIMMYDLITFSLQIMSFYILFVDEKLLLKIKSKFFKFGKLPTKPIV